MKKWTNQLWLAPGRVLLALLAAFFLTSTPAQATHRSGNLVERLQRDGRFTTLLTALEVAGLKGTVATGGVFTVFVPTTEAFATLPPGTVELLVTNVPALQNILLSPSNCLDSATCLPSCAIIHPANPGI